MKALFLMPDIHECHAIQKAWHSWDADPSFFLSYDITGGPRDQYIIRKVRRETPDVIFYIGGTSGSGMPKPKTLKWLRSFAPVIHLCWDATDEPWHQLLELYKSRECFDLQVAMDGGLSPGIDFATLTPVDPTCYNIPGPDRTIECGFAGQNAAYGHPRYPILTRLIEKGLVTHRARDDGEYHEYVKFLQSCKLGINFSHCGSGNGHHIKIRVIEIAMAGAGLLEMYSAPTPLHFPKEYIYFYEDVGDVKELLLNLDEDERVEKAAGLKNFVEGNFSARKIFTDIVARLEL